MVILLCEQVVTNVLLSYLQTLETMKILEKRWERYHILSAACTYSLIYQNCTKLSYVKRYLQTVTSTSTVIYGVQCGKKA